MAKNILIVDDSALMRRVLSDIINSDERFKVIETAINGLVAFDMIVCNPSKYDAIILDINMPKMDGIEFLENLNKQGIRQTVIVVSTVAKEGAKETIRALELGAFDFVTKPDSFIDAKSNTFKTRILECLTVAVNSSRFRSPLLRKSNLGIQNKNLKVNQNPNLDYKRDKVVSPMSTISNNKRERIKPHVKVSKNASKLVALACSTGGPKALQSVVPLLPADLDAPVLIVQHMPVGFTASLASRLNELSKINVKEAENGEILKKGTVYIAKGGTHMCLKRQVNGSYIIENNEIEPARGGLRPCADVMYESLINSKFDDITCVVLTGMGADGTQGISKLEEKKNIYVIAQNEETSTVYGMPKMIVESGLTDEILPLIKIADAITKNVGVQ